ncbi:MAG: flagellar hook-associated protein FlgK [Siculibacillus sp.]|nr:flagellar hook-associated protein FlgK [Siculibacillus sp.]
MTIGSALSIAVAGMQLNQTETGVVAQNIARAGQAGYTAKRVGAVDFQGLQGAFGLKAVVHREFDKQIWSQVLQSTSPTSYLETQQTYLSQLDQFMGQTDNGASVPSALATFDQSLHALVTSPEDVSSRMSLLEKAQVLASRLNQASDDVQSLRTSAESEIADQVAKVNALTAQISDLNSRIVGQANAGQDVSNLLDARDEAVKNLSSYMDIGTRENADGHLAVFTTSGLSLVSDHGTQFEFDSHGTLNANRVWSDDDADRGVGTIRVVDDGSQVVDLISSGALRSGSLAALVELRDVTLVQAQAQLDDIAAGLAEAMSNHTVEGTAASSGAAEGFDLDLTGLQSGNRVTLTHRDVASGEDRTVTFIRVDDAGVLPLSDSATPDPNDTVHGIDFSGGTASVAAQIQAALGASFDVSNPSGDTLRILGDGGVSTDVTGLSASVTSTALQDGETGLPLFTQGAADDFYTGSFEVGSQKIGFSSRIAVNPAVIADPSILVTWQTSPATEAGDPTRPQALLDRLETLVFDFGSETGMSAEGHGFSATLADFADRVVSFWGAASSSAASAYDSQSIIQSNLEQRMEAVSGVNVDQELARLIQLQSAYAANARVMTTAKEMLDALMRS